MRMRTITMWYIALLACRSPPRLNQCRLVFPEEAGIRLAPVKAAECASVRSRSGWSPAVISN